MSPGGLGADLERLPGVLAATVFDDAAAPRVYLATAATADPSTLRAAVLALLEDRGLHADPTRIHIAAPPRALGVASPLPKVSLDSLDVHRRDGRVECVLGLRGDGRNYKGSAGEPDTIGGRARAASRAVLAALEGVDPELRLGLHGARSLELFGRDAVLVLLEATLGRVHVHLPGVALVERSVEEAAALATLSALRSWGG